VTFKYSLLDEPLVRARLVDGGRSVQYSLPGLFVALANDEVRDFPALRPHQRHPWHAFLVQLAAMALYHAGRDQPFDTEQGWKDALLALTPDYPDGEAWYLITPLDKPAFMQPPVPSGKVSGWVSDRPTPDSLDILITSKNHDLKATRMRLDRPDDWIFSLVSLQTQAPYPGPGNYGIARMNGGSSSRPGLGIKPPGSFGKRWSRDLSIALKARIEVLRKGYSDEGGIGLLWLLPWDGKAALSFTALDPFFIEICRKVRLTFSSSGISALRATSEGPRIFKDEAKARKGNTGDLWTPIHKGEGKSLGVSSSGFGYKRMVELAFGSDYEKPPAQNIQTDDSHEGLILIAQAIAGGQSTTDGYHERHIPISPKVRKLFIQKQTDYLAKIAEERVDAIERMRSVLWTALALLFDQAAEKDEFSKSARGKANDFSKSFEQSEDSHFFDELNTEIGSDDPDEIRLQWLLSMADRAEAILKNAFVSGPQSGERRYRARSAALTRFHSGLRSDKALPTLADHYRRQLTTNKESANESA